MPVTESQRRIGGARITVRAVALGVVGVTSLWMLLLVSKTWYLADDFLDLNQARQQGLTWHYLAESVFGHFIPGFRLFYWILAVPLSSDYRWVEAFTVVLFALALWLFAETAFLLFGQRLGVVYATAAFGCSLLLTPSLLWFASLLETLPTAAASLGCFYFYLRWNESRQAGWLVAMGVAFCAGLSFYEIMLVLPVALALVEVIFLRTTSEHRSPAWLLWRQWPGLVVLGIPSLLYLWYDTSQHYLSGSPSPSAGVAAGTYIVAWFESIGPTFFGHSVFDQPPPSLWVVAAGQLVFVVAVGAALVRDARRTLRTLLFLFLSYVAYLAPMALTRAGSFGTGIGRDFLYLTPYAWLLPLCALFAWYPLEARAEVGRAKRRRLLPPVMRGVGVGLVAVLLAATVAGQWSQMDLVGAPHRSVRTVETNYVASVERLNAHHVRYFVYDTKLPSDLMVEPLIVPYDLLSQTVGPMAPPVTYSTSVSNRLPGYVVLPDGRLVRGSLSPYAILTSDQTVLREGTFCMPSRQTAVNLTIDVSPVLPSALWELGLASVSGGLGTTPVTVQTDSGSVDTLPALFVRSGDAAYMSLSPTSVSKIIIQLPPGGRFCGEMAIGVPKPR